MAIELIYSDLQALRSLTMYKEAYPLHFDTCLQTALGHLPQGQHSPYYYFSYTGLLGSDLTQNDKEPAGNIK